MSSDAAWNCRNHSGFSLVYIPARFRLKNVYFSTITDFILLFFLFLTLKPSHFDNNRLKIQRTTSSSCQFVFEHESDEYRSGISSDNNHMFLFISIHRCSGGTRGLSRLTMTYFRRGLFSIMSKHRDPLLNSPGFFSKSRSSPSLTLHFAVQRFTLTFKFYNLSVYLTLPSVCGASGSIWAGSLDGFQNAIGMFSLQNRAGRGWKTWQEETDYLQSAVKIQSFVWQPRGQLRWRRCGGPESDGSSGGGVNRMCDTQSAGITGTHGVPSLDKKPASN